MVNPMIASAILGELERPKMPTALPLPDMRGAFGLSPQAFMQMYDAQMRQNAGQAQLQAEAAQQYEQRRQFDIQAQATRDKMISDAWLGQKGVETDTFQAQTGRMGVKESTRSNQAREKLAGKEFKETKRANRVDEENAAAGVAQGWGRLGLAEEQLDWDKIMDQKRFKTDKAQSEALSKYYDSMSQANTAKAQGGGTSPLSVNDQRTLNTMADGLARNRLGIPPDEPIPSDKLAEYEEIVNQYLTYQNAPPLPGALPVDFDFSGAILKPGW